MRGPVESGLDALVTLARLLLVPTGEDHEVAVSWVMQALGPLIEVVRPSAELVARIAPMTETPQARAFALWVVDEGAAEVRRLDEARDLGAQARFNAEMLKGIVRRLCVAREIAAAVGAVSLILQAAAAQRSSALSIAVCHQTLGRADTWLRSLKEAIK